MQINFKKSLSFVIIIAILFSFLTTINVFAANDYNEAGKYHAYKDTSVEATTVLNYGKNLGLGIKKLHDKGYTGKGITVAYVDQPVLKTHEQFTNLNIHYLTVRDNDSTMKYSQYHGTSVLSILAGNTIGVAPESEVYFVSHPSWQMDMSTNAEALRKLIETNKTLPSDKKIRIVGYSDSANHPEKKNTEDFNNAIREAENNGIMVFTCTDPFTFTRATIKYPNDKNDSKNYIIDPVSFGSGPILATPTNGISSATNKSDNDYTYWENDGGLSWETPFVVGLAAIGLQIDPTLTKDQIIKYIVASKNSNHLINPEGFVDLVKKNAKTISPNAPKEPYYYVLYNSTKVTNDDLTAIKDYTTTYLDNAILKDVSSYSNAIQIYDMLKADYNTRTNGTLKGIQIFGAASSNNMSVSNGEVPAFNIGFKIQLLNNQIDSMGYYNTDFFYSTFKNDSSLIGSQFNLYDMFKNKMNINLVPEWAVSRLPLKMGEISQYLKKYKDYANKTNGNILDTVNFSNPIFANNIHVDDVGEFIKKNLDEKYGIIKNDQYRLYGNLDGKYPVQNSVLGNITKDNLTNENSKEIVNFFINTHGQPNNIDQAIFEKTAASSEKRVSLINNNNVNTVLNKNYYNMILWTCNNGFDLRNDNIVHQMLVGNAVNIFASSTVLSNSGANNSVSFEKLKENNFYYFQYVYFYYYYKLHQSMSDSFFAAKKAYVEEVLKHTNILGEGNYQFNLNNALQYHYFGVLEKSDYYPITNVDITPKNKIATVNNNSNPNIKIDAKYVIKGNTVTINIAYEIKQKYEKASCVIFDYTGNPDYDQKIFTKVAIFKKSNGNLTKDTATVTLDKNVFFKADQFAVNVFIDGKFSTYVFPITK